MGIGKRIKEARERLGMTQSELAEIVGVTGSAITNYEKETSHPKEPIMYKLFDALQVDANFLFQDVVNIPKKINDVTFSEYENIIKKYRFISEYSPEGTETVDYILNREYKIAEQIKETIQERVLPEASEIDMAENPDLKSQPPLSPEDINALKLGRASNQQGKKKA